MTPEQGGPEVLQVRRELTRRRFLHWGARVGIGGATAAVLGGGLLAACTGDGDGEGGGAPSRGEGGAGRGDVREVKVGVIAPFSGPFSFIGEIVRASIGAVVGYLDAEQGGQFRGLRPVVVEKDAPLSPQDGQRAYTELAADRDVLGIVWGGSPGLAESLPQITQDGTLNVSAFTDLQGFAPLTGLDLNSSAASGLGVFQKAMPDPLAFDVMLDYARNDRGYDTAALLYEPTFFPTAKEHFERFSAEHGLQSRGVHPYDITQGHPDYVGPLQRIASEGTESLFLWGLSDNTAAIAVEIAKLGGQYVDTPTAKAERFKPHIMGSPGGTGGASFKRQAGDAASRGTITAWYMGGIVALPSFPIRDWIADYQPGYNGGVIRGGEDGPGDALIAVLNAAAEADSTRPDAMIAALEGGLETQFCSPVGFSWAADRHVSLVRDDIILVSLEYPPEPFNLGAEWDEVFAPGYQGPTHLVDFTLENNRRLHPEVVEEILSTKYGTSCRPEYQDGDRAKIEACRRIA